MRLAVYTDYVYRRVDGVVYAERAFALFLAAVAPHVERLRLIGRIAPNDGEMRYALPGELELAGLPHYESLANPTQALRSLIGSISHMWRSLEDIDVVWILGPFPHAVVLASVALVRRTPVVIGVRQDWPSYVRMRRPGRRWMHLSADVLEWIWRALARRVPVVAVGPELSERYAHAPAVLNLVVSLVPSVELEKPVPHREYGGELRILSVGRLDEEKNPLLLADVLAVLDQGNGRWRLRVCGEGDLARGLEDRLSALGVRAHADMLGYVPMGDELLDLYRSSHALLHVSLTEGFPQVIVEAFACGLPTVATDVGGVRAVVDEAALLVEPGDAAAAARALQRVASDAELRDTLTRAGLQRAHEFTREVQVERLVSFLREMAHRPRPRWRSRRPLTSPDVGALKPDSGGIRPMETKQEREQSFHDTAFAESTRASVWGFYKVTRASREAFAQALLAEGLAGKRVLEYGSGAAAQAFFLAAQGAEVVGIDISPVAVEQGRRRASDEHLDERIEFHVMDAERLEFADDAFDLVCGSGVLHHLDLALAYSEIARVLRPGGAAVFLEPLGHNPLINAYRHRTPQLRTVDEHPLLMPDLDRARDYFRDVDASFFHLIGLAAIPFRDRSGFDSLLSTLDRLDRHLFDFAPALRKHAWFTVVRLGSPYG